MKNKNKEKACTQWIVDKAMEITSKDVQLPKCVRNGLVKPIKKIK